MGDVRASFCLRRALLRWFLCPCLRAARTHQISNLTFSSGMVLVRKAAPTVEACASEGSFGA